METETEAEVIEGEKTEEGCDTENNDVEMKAVNEDGMCSQHQCYLF